MCRNPLDVNCVLDAGSWQVSRWWSKWSQTGEQDLKPDVEPVTGSQWELGCPEMCCNLETISVPKFISKIAVPCIAPIVPQTRDAFDLNGSLFNVRYKALILWFLWTLMRMLDRWGRSSTACSPSLSASASVLSSATPWPKGWAWERRSLSRMKRAKPAPPRSLW